MLLLLLVLLALACLREAEPFDNMKAITNATYGHHGEMAFPEVTLVPWNKTNDRPLAGPGTTTTTTNTPAAAAAGVAGEGEGGGWLAALIDPFAAARNRTASNLLRRYNATMELLAGKEERREREREFSYCVCGVRCAVCCVKKLCKEERGLQETFILCAVHYRALYS